jgi:CRISPR-associated HD domain protein
MISSNILAFYKRYNDGKVFIETLNEHINLCLEFFKKFEETRFWKSINISLKEEYVKFAIIYHDVGKIFYQKHLIRDKEKGIEYLSFRGHEFISTWMLKRVLEKRIKKLILEGLDEKTVADIELLSKSAQFAVLYHHHAMDIKERLNELDMINIREFTEEEYQILSKEFSSVYKIKLEDIDPSFNNFLCNKNEMNKKLKEIKFNVENINSEIWRIYNTKPFNKKVMLTFLLALIYVDYKASKTSRSHPEEPPGFFINVINEIDNYAYF